MPNPIFENQKGQSSGGGIYGMIFNRMYRGNPAFRDFVNRSKGKSIDEICQQNGIDPQQVKGMSDNDIAAFLSKNGMF